MLLQHSFEMLFKSIILKNHLKIYDSKGKYTIGFDKCLKIMCEELKFISSDERATLSILDAQRDQATHYYSELSEDILYVHAQSSVTLFDSLIKSHFGHSLSQTVSGRVLPISASPPRDLMFLLDNELSQIDDLLGKSTRKGALAVAQLRSVMAFVNGAKPEAERVSDHTLSAAVSKRRKGEEWGVIFPEIAYLKLSTDGTGIPISMKISKEAPFNVQVLKPGQEGEVIGTIIKQEIDPWSVYNLSRNDIAEKLGISGPKAHALIYELKIQDDSECYKILRKGSLVFKGYSKKALDLLRNSLLSLDIEDVWNRQKHKLGSFNRNKKKPLGFTD
jgi:hypothetical protein